MTDYMPWRRAIALSESKALRALLRTHGRLPTVVPSVPSWRQYVNHANNPFTGAA